MVKGLFICMRSKVQSPLLQKEKKKVEAKESLKFKVGSRNGHSGRVDMEECVCVRAHVHARMCVKLFERVFTVRWWHWKVSKKFCMMGHSIA